MCSYCPMLYVEETGMICKGKAMAAGYGDHFHHVSLKNADKTPVRCRVNGKCKTWKTRPAEFRLPVKHGMRDCFYIDNSNCDEWLEGYGS
jgi:hypothetical protein